MNPFLYLKYAYNNDMITDFKKFKKKYKKMSDDDKSIYLLDSLNYTHKPFTLYCILSDLDINIYNNRNYVNLCCKKGLINILISKLEKCDNVKVLKKILDCLCKAIQLNENIKYITNKFTTRYLKLLKKLFMNNKTRYLYLSFLCSLSKITKYKAFICNSLITNVDKIKIMNITGILKTHECLQICLILNHVLTFDFCIYKVHTSKIFSQFISFCTSKVLKGIDRKKYDFESYLTFKTIIYMLIKLVSIHSFKYRTKFAKELLLYNFINNFIKSYCFMNHYGIIPTHFDELIIEIIEIFDIPNINILLHTSTFEVCIRNSYNDITKFFLRNIIDVNEQIDVNNHTMLHAALKYGHFEIAKYLILKGCDVDMINIKNISPRRVFSSFVNKYLLFRGKLMNKYKQNILIHCGIHYKKHYEKNILDIIVKYIQLDTELELFLSMI
jgi:hypothetical protein